MKFKFMILMLACLQIFPQNSGESSRLVSSRYPLPNTETDYWQYLKVAHADIDGDGEIERVEILAKIEQFRTKGSLDDKDFAWDDSHMWAVRIIEKSGDTTLVYHNMLHMSKLDGYVSKTDPPSFYLAQSGRGTLTVYEIFYKGPNKVRVEDRVNSKFESGTRLISRKYSDFWPKN